MVHPAGLADRQVHHGRMEGGRPPEKVEEHPTQVDRTADLPGAVELQDPVGGVGEQDANWNRRFRAHQEQLKSSDPRELAGVIRNLARRQDEKGLSGGERQLLMRAKRLLASELQYARKTDEEEALAWIDDVLSPEARAA